MAAGPRPRARRRCRGAPRRGPGRASRRRPSRGGPSRTVRAKSPPLMLRPSAVDGTGWPPAPGRRVPAVTPATGVSESSSAASSRPRCADARNSSAARTRRRPASRAVGCAATPCAAPRRWRRGRPGRAASPARGGTGLHVQPQPVEVPLPPPTGGPPPLAAAVQRPLLALRLFVVPAT